MQVGNKYDQKTKQVIGEKGRQKGGKNKYKKRRFKSFHYVKKCAYFPPPPKKNQTKEKAKEASLPSKFSLGEKWGGGPLAFVGGGRSDFL